MVNESTAESDPEAPPPNPDADWMRRYKARLIEHHNLSDAGAEGLTNAVDFEDLRDSFATDPEGAADEEMSYASDDGDDDGDEDNVEGDDEDDDNDDEEDDDDDDDD